jgi:hypothetical protein
MLFNDAVECEDYVASMRDAWMSFRGYWNDTDRETRVLLPLLVLQF